MKLRKHVAGIFFISFVCVISFIAWIVFRAQLSRVEEVNRLPIEQNTVAADMILGQNFIVGIPEITLNAITKEALHKIKPGGVVLYSRNYSSPEQFKSLIKELQTIAKDDSGVPYFIMIDEEPNGASRLDLLKNVFTLGLPDWGKINNGIAILGDLGVNVELAPVTDFPFNKDSFILKRVPAKTPEDLSAFNQTFIELLAEKNISATLKHFPGGGILVEDPHKAIPRGYANQQFFDQSLALFKNGIDAGAQFVMVNHAIYQNIDPDNPATLSRLIVTGLLKEKLGFKGIVITDDIEDMLSPIWDIDPADAGVRALLAGNTMIMYSQNLESTKNTFEEIKKAIEEDAQLKNIIKSNYQQIVTFKKHKL